MIRRTTKGIAPDDLGQAAWLNTIAAWSCDAKLIRFDARYISHALRRPHGSRTVA
jgi:hypothetical protein